MACIGVARRSMAACPETSRTMSFVPGRSAVRGIAMTASIRPGVSPAASMPGMPLPPIRRPFHHAVLANLPDTNRPSGFGAVSSAGGTSRRALSQRLRCCGSTDRKPVVRHPGAEKSGGVVSPRCAGQVVTVAMSIHCIDCAAAEPKGRQDRHSTRTSNRWERDDIEGM